ncbi:hypothetical protein JCM15548_13788 [Geofilum rubicundum JCM 15548]|uniref:Uncharacterized protein n=1 Tax=Geofilum rubicundum JCM 15548 TaxID=1236989 RepID=A0A0E9M1J8_9BACT|nr:hypothetical protein JCM15548_13788 [Geofilum rubicundum JCM 15548]
MNFSTLKYLKAPPLNGWGFFIENHADGIIHEKKDKKKRLKRGLVYCINQKKRYLCNALQKQGKR